MTTPGNHHYDLTMDEVSRIGNAVGPAIREGIRKDLSEQTKDIGAIVKAHEGNIRESFDSHEQNDADRFDKIDRRLISGDSRMQKIEVRLAYFSGALGVLMFIAPFVVDYIKSRFGIHP